MVVKTNSTWKVVDFVGPGQRFGFEVYYDLTKNTSRKIRSESFHIAQEGGGLIEGTEVTVKF